MIKDKRSKAIVRRMAHIVLPALVLGTVFLLLNVSCSARQDVELRADGSGSTTVRIDLHPIFVQYLRDLTAGLSSDGAEGYGLDAENEEVFRIFDEFKIAEAFARTDGAVLQDFQRRAPGHIQLTASFENPAEVLPSPEGIGVAPVVEFSQEGKLRTLEFTLTSENASSLYGLLGMQEQQTMITFGPQPDPLSEREYIDMMVYALGTYAEEHELKKALRSQNLQVVVQVDGEVLSAEGFTLRGGRAEATIPFLQPATLFEPLELSLRWRAP